MSEMTSSPPHPFETTCTPDWHIYDTALVGGEVRFTAPVAGQVCRCGEVRFTAYGAEPTGVPS